MRTKDGPVYKTPKPTSETFSDKKQSKFDASARNKEALRNKAAAVKNENERQSKAQPVDRKKKSVAEVMGTYQKQHRLKLERKLDGNAEVLEENPTAYVIKKPPKESSLERNQERPRKKQLPPKVTEWAEFNIEDEIEDMLADDNVNQRWSDQKLPTSSHEEEISEAEVELKMALKYKDFQSPEPVNVPVNSQDTAPTPSLEAATLFASQQDLASQQAKVGSTQEVEQSIPSKAKKVARKQRAKSRLDKSPPKNSEPVKKSQSSETGLPNTVSSTTESPKPSSEKPKPKISVPSIAKEKLPDNFIKTTAGSKPALKKESVEKPTAPPKDETKQVKNVVSKDEMKPTYNETHKNSAKETNDKKSKVMVESKANASNVQTTSTPQPLNSTQVAKSSQGSSAVNTQPTGVNKQGSLRESSNNNRARKVGVTAMQSAPQVTSDDKRNTNKKESDTNRPGIMDKLKNFVG